MQDVKVKIIQNKQNIFIAPYIATGTRGNETIYTFLNIQHFCINIHPSPNQG